MKPDPTDFSVVIPARMASTRLPGKPLLKIGNKSLIQHVCDQAAKSLAQQVVVATDDNRIFDHVKTCGFEAVMTSPDCQSGTDRIAEAVRSLKYADNSVIVNLQGDEPFMPANVINQVAAQLIANPSASMSTACEQLENQSDWSNPDVVKVVRNAHDDALYFSRSLIPYSPEGREQNVYKHLGIYAYTVSYISEYASLNPCALEKTEKLEQLRALWHGHKISVCEITHHTGIGVDTPADLELARKIYQENSNS